MAPDVPETPDAIEAVAILSEPNRRRLYEFVVASEDAVGRDDAAAAMRFSRHLAAFHLDRLVEAGLLETEYRRRGSRRGPGAGRPAKLYRRAGHEIAVTLPQRAYERIGAMLASAVSRLGATGSASVADVAHDDGRSVGLEARARAGRRPGHRSMKAALLDVLRGAGFEPLVDGDSGDVRLRNCPYHALAEAHRDLTCGTNIAWAEGVVNGLDDPGLRAELKPEPGRCCVVVREVV